MAENRMEANTAASTSLNMLEDRLTNSLWKIHNLELSLQSTGSAGVVGQRLNELVEDMREIDNIGEALKDLKIPVELLQYIDQGGHPELFASAAVSKGYEENQRSRGKAEAFAQLRDAVLRRAREAFPEETAAYLRASGEPLVATKAAAGDLRLPKVQLPPSPRNPENPETLRPPFPPLGSVCPPVPYCLSLHALVPKPKPSRPSRLAVLPCCRRDVREGLGEKGLEVRVKGTFDALGKEGR
eukprot:CAMPEP_0177580178 /NCGR_PEP_ID=MMETSP0419_2-20121207/1408_1 /TAXON_ID=582737 /ORGANISM="Tetraselmis sp., Strain GSL018" /LENGTH=241 /DNA_ID=CAMNT_0019069001 /DNA_START=191 /DNA_END=912 /DNA_ORIENTATION=-